ncbi:MAG: ABC transporter ATP-binding protein [Lachnospiraceae bacterium]|nr:ABC transporter ATP-binding protein [Candidatus Merdinaster equi]
MRDTIHKLKKVLNKKQKGRVILLIIMILIGAVLETASVSLILPVVEVVMTPDAVNSTWYIKAICDFFHITTNTDFLKLSLIALIILFAGKNLYMYLLYYVQHTFIANCQFRISRDLLQIYLHKPYEYYLNASTGEVMRTVYSDTTGVFSLLLQCMQFLTELVVGLCLGITVFLIDAKMTIVLAVILIITMALIFKIVRPKISAVGQESREKLSIMYNGLMQSIGSIKDVKVYDKEDSFLKSYIKYGRRYYTLVRDNNLYGSIPKILIEAVCICGVLAYMLIAVCMGQSIGTLMPQLTAFAVAAMRLMPSASRMSTYLANISYYKPNLDYVYKNVEMPGEDDYRKSTDANEHNTDTAHKIALKDSIELKGVTYKYPGADRYIFQNADMHIPIGASVGIMGPSGAGKSTIVDVMLGLLKPEKGEITTGGISVFDDYPGWLHNIGYIPQFIGLINDTIAANVAFGIDAEEIDEDKVWRALEEAQLKEFVDSLPDKLDTKIGERGVRISGGQRQRIGIARALYHNPEVLVLDEATSALDNDTEAAIMDAINRFHGKKTMLIIAHRLKTIENCDLIYRVENEKLILNEHGLK